MPTPTPAPYPTSGNAIPRTWECESVQTTANAINGTGGTQYERCAVTSWQAQSPQPYPTPTTNNTTNNTYNTYSGTSEADTQPGISEQTFGFWSDDWTTFLVGATLATAAVLLLVALYFVWARKAILGT
jgi:hypothetical protein